MPRRVILEGGRPKSQIITDAHHRAGYMRIGKYSKVWCSCGWVDELQAEYTEMMAAFEAHKPV